MPNYEDPEEGNDGIPDLQDPDRDGDGWTNAAEEAAGTDPDDAGSFHGDEENEDWWKSRPKCGALGLEVMMCLIPFTFRSRRGCRLGAKWRDVLLRRRSRRRPAATSRPSPKIYVYKPSHLSY